MEHFCIVCDGSHIEETTELQFKICSCAVEKDISKIKIQQINKFYDTLNLAERQQIKKFKENNYGRGRTIF